MKLKLCRATEHGGEPQPPDMDMSWNCSLPTCLALLAPPAPPTHCPDQSRGKETRTKITSLLKGRENIRNSHASSRPG